MRRTTVAIILVGLTAAFVFFLATRERTDLPSAAASPAETSETGKETGDGEKSSGVKSPSDPSAEAEADSKAPKTKVALGRPLRVIAHGWDLVVPGLVAKSKGEFKRRGLDVEYRSVGRLADIETALAAGGEAKKGADIAIVALPLLALTYEDLRALRPELFWVVGFSRGRDALYAAKADLLKPPRKKLKLVGDRERASTFLSLFALDLAGVDVSKVAVVSPDDPKRSGASFAAVDRSMANAERLKSGRKPLLSTADATALVPYVAIAPRGFLEQNSDVATAFGAAWLRGVDELRRDVPAAARSVAALEGTPEPVVLIKRLGQIEFVDLDGNARLLALSGRGAISAHELFRTSFRIWRKNGIITTAAPEVAPIAPGAVSTLVFGKGVRAATDGKAAAAPEAKPLLVTKPAKVDEDGAIERIGTLAGLFSRSVIEVGFNGTKKSSEMAIGRAAERFGIDRSRLVAAPKRSKRRHLTLAVMPIP